MQLMDKLERWPEHAPHDNLASLALDQLLQQKQVLWAPAFDQTVLIAAPLTDRLTAGYKGSLIEDSAPAQDFQSLAGLQAQNSGKGAARTNGVQGNGHTGSTNPLSAVASSERAATAQTQRVLSVVMRNPGEMTVWRKHLYRTAS